MSDTDGKKPLGLHGSRPGNVKQSFSHGRTKNVVVETKRKRVVVPKPGGAAQGSAATGVVRGDPSKRPAGISEAELERRMRALAFYEEQKARRVKKIKSKLYRKIRRKQDERARAQTETHDRKELRRLDPELLEQMDEKANEAV